mgnify:CR=1 FL=1
MYYIPESRTYLQVESRLLVFGIYNNTALGIWKSAKYWNPESTEVDCNLHLQNSSVHLNVFVLKKATHVMTY